MPYEKAPKYIANIQAERLQAYLEESLWIDVNTGQVETFYKVVVFDTPTPPRDVSLKVLRMADIVIYRSEEGEFLLDGNRWYGCEWFEGKLNILLQSIKDAGRLQFEISLLLGELYIKQNKATYELGF